MNVDVLLKVLAYAIVPLFLAVVGNVIAARGIEDRRTRLRLQVAFFALLAVGALAGYLVERRSAVEHDDELRVANAAYGDLRQRSSQISAALSSENSYLLGRLDTISSLLGGMSSGRATEDYAILKALTSNTRSGENASENESTPHARMGRLLAEGRELNSKCQSRQSDRPITPQILGPIRDWEKRAYAEAAADADPKLLPLWDKFGPMHPPHTVQDACTELVGHFSGFRDIMTGEFSK